MVSPVVVIHPPARSIRLDSLPRCPGDSGLVLMDSLAIGESGGLSVQTSDSEEEGQRRSVSISNLPSLPRYEQHRMFDFN